MFETAIGGVVLSLDHFKVVYFAVDNIAEILVHAFTEISREYYLGLFISVLLPKMQEGSELLYILTRYIQFIADSNSGYFLSYSSHICLGFGLIDFQPIFLNNVKDA